MKKMDEMDRNIRLRSESLGYKTALFCLAVWTLYDSWQTLSSGGARAHNILSVMIMTAALCVQSFSEMAMKRKMTAGDEEYKESNKILRAVIIIIATAAVILSFGSYLIIKLN